MARTRRKKHTVFKTFAILCVLVLVVGATVTITLALLNNTSDTKTNTFVSDNKLGLELTEPGWDSTGKQKADVYTPGLIIPKDPTLTNTATFENKTKYTTTTQGTLAEIKDTAEYKAKSEYVALKLEYQVLKAERRKEEFATEEDLNNDDNWEDIKYSEFTKLAKIMHKSNLAAPGPLVEKANGNDGFDLDNWMAKEDGDYATGRSKENTVFYYKTPLGPEITDFSIISDASNDNNHKTIPLFDAVEIDKNLTQETIFNCHGSNHFQGNFQSTSVGVWSKLKEKIDQTGGYNIYTPESVPASSYKYKLQTAPDEDASYTYVHVGLVPFRIKVTGYAVQAYLNNSKMDLTLHADDDSSYDSEAVVALNKLMDVPSTTPAPAP